MVAKIGDHSIDISDEIGVLSVNREELGPEGDGFGVYFEEGEIVGCEVF